MFVLHHLAEDEHLLKRKNWYKTSFCSCTESNGIRSREGKLSHLADASSFQRAFDRREYLNLHQLLR